MTRPTRTTHIILATALATAVAFTVASCSTEPPVSDRDASALATLAGVAGPTSGVDAEDVTRTECWLPSDHLIDDDTVNDTTWRVMCRAHYEDESGDRYQDTTCVGDFALDPEIEHCYRWTFYTGMPQFDDFAAVTAG